MHQVLPGARHRAWYRSRMHKHATEDAHKPEKTLCGADVTKVAVDNADPDCKRCLRVIRSRCFEHNVARCKVCPKGWYVLGGNRVAP